jgi:hypothetical protein
MNVHPKALVASRWLSPRWLPRQKTYSSSSGLVGRGKTTALAAIADQNGEQHKDDGATNHDGKEDAHFETQDGCCWIQGCDESMVVLKAGQDMLLPSAGGQNSSKSSKCNHGWIITMADERGIISRRHAAKPNEKP